eukprot:1060023-Prorocentrum_minimum.AAC.2
MLVIRRSGLYARGENRILAVIGAGGPVKLSNSTLAVRRSRTERGSWATLGHPGHPGHPWSPLVTLAFQLF